MGLHIRKETRKAINGCEIMVSKYLQFTKYIDQSKQIIELANKFKADKQNSIYKNISFFLKTLKSEKHMSKIFRKRKASEILESNFETGCTDRALVFISLARSCGIPTKYVETINPIIDGKLKGHFT